MTKPDFDAAKAYALQRLTDELPPAFYYHCLQHTRDDVVPAVKRLVLGEEVNSDGRLCLLTAAYFHDLGYIEQSQDHEDIGAQIAADVLPGFGYSSQQIETIRRLIMATKLPQTPVTLLEQIIADADLDSLGRDDFLKTSLALRDELSAAGLEFSDLEWYRRQAAFLRTHQYFTETARRLRGSGKRRNIHLLQQLIAEITLRQE